MARDDAVMKVGLVGCGGIARAHGEAIAASPKLTLQACADFIDGKAEAYAREFAVPQSFASMEQLLREAHVDLLLLATFPANHVAEIQQAIELGAPAILCEKALAMNGEEGERIGRLARESGVFVCEGLTYRHHPQIARAKQIIEAGEIGEVTSIQAHFSDSQKGEPDPNNWRNRVELGGGTIAAKGCYLIDALTHFINARPLQVICHTTCHPGHDFDIAQTATIVYENTAVGQFESSHRGAWRHAVHISGTEGWLDIPAAVVTKNQPREIEICNGSSFGDEQGQRRVEKFPPLDSYRLQLEHVYETLYHDAPFPMPLEQSIRNLHVTSALLESARTRCWTPVNVQAAKTPDGAAPG